MLEFRDIDISDKDRINSALKKSLFMGCEYCFANNMAWKRLSDTKISFYKDFYISCAFKTGDGIPSFTFPSGYGSYKDLISELKRFTDNMGVPLRFTGVTDALLPVFDELYEGRFICENNRDDSDYIYNSEDLITLPGKKYHQKRNHLARFHELDYTYSPITENDIDDCITFLVHTYNAKTSDNKQSFIAEQYAINTFFTYFRELDLCGGIIRIDGEPAAVTLGEGGFGDVFYVHIEKADTQFSGIYAGINNLFAKQSAEKYKYINREEDLGIEGLRKSKLSYKPAFLLNKYTVTFK